MQVGWIGTGTMGEPMAGRLLAAGHALTVHNRTAGRTARLVERGARAAPTVAAAGGEVVITMLPAPREVMDDVLANAVPGTVVVDCSTSAPDLARHWAEEGERRGVSVLDAPVSGGPAGAKAGTLSIMVGGDASAFALVRPLLETLGTTVVHHGPPGTGQLAKLVNQTVVAGATLAACEAYALAVHGGLDIAKVLASVGLGVAGSPLLDFLWSRLAAADLEPGFKLDHLLKDLSLVHEAAGELPMPATERAGELAERIRAVYGGERGTQVLVKVAER
ncbi:MULTISPECIES: NAD(P)-dependent oxidoreductase [Nonomuraea]|uniref:NAD(P)-dependent oxidoreductase n=1 Tax=Nonomuraea mangrovi TaxID=2316207 RepID=A0ABW4SXW1_9ACTN